MQGVLGFSVFLLLVSSCSCSRRLMPSTMTDYFDDLDGQNDYGGAFGNDDELLAAKATSVNVMDYGAAGNGQTDDSQAFKKAWQAVCTNGNGATLVVPPGKTFLLNPVAFTGPCKGNRIHFQLQGTLMAPPSTTWTNAGYYLILFSGIENLNLDGGGKIDGQGSYWWKSCTRRPRKFERLFSCQQRPGILQFYSCNGLRLSGLTHLNSPRAHISINACKDVDISELNIIAPDESPNTDGIDISSSSNINIRDSKIGTGDDCVAINGGSSFINITHVQCGPGHGISIGSLGDGPYDTVEEVHVSDCHLKNTQNGVRIKTFQGASGYARKITFEDITFEDVNNPIIIDQYYQDKSKHRNGVMQKSAAIKVSDVTYSGLKGTSASAGAINLNCDKLVGCSNIVMQNIDINSANPGQQTYGTCNNVKGTVSSTEPKLACLNQQY